MFAFSDLFSFFYLFLALGALIILVTILYNILHLSYKPKQAIFFIVPIGVMFMICVGLGFFHLNILSSSINNRTQPKTSPSRQF